MNGSSLVGSPSASQTPRKLKVTPPMMMWYDLLPLVPFIICFGTVYIHIFDVLSLTSSYSFFFLVGRGASFCDRWCYGERSGDSSICCYLRREKEPSSGGVVEEVR